MSHFPTANVKLDEGPWPELMDRPVTEVHHFEVAWLPNGMQSGDTALALKIQLPDESFVVVHTSLKLWRIINSAIDGAEERRARNG